MIRCFLSSVDKTFDSSKDIMAGPWCLGLQEGDFNFFEPYTRDEILFYHRKLFNLAFFLLKRDLKNETGQLKKINYLLLLDNYLFFVFFAFSRYRVLKKILDNFPPGKLIFEDVSEPQEGGAFFLNLSSKVSGYLLSKILDCLVEDKEIKRFQSINEFSKINPNNAARRSSQVFFFRKIKSKLKNILNYFHDIDGIYFFQGMVLSLFYNLTHRRNKNESVSFVSYEPMIELDREVNEFIKIFDNLSAIFIKKKVGAFDANLRVHKLNIKYPSFIYNSQKFKNIVISQLEKKTNFILMQHGSHYATNLNHFRREIEYNFVSFITWGKKWFSYLDRKNIINFLPSPRLSLLADSYTFKDQKDILWVTGVHYKGGDGLEYFYGTEVLKYIEKKIDFYKYVDINLREFIVCKALKPTLEPEQFYDKLQNILREKYVTEGTATERMYNAKILFLDYYGTPFYEAMSMNVPVVLAMLEGIPLFTEEASHIFQKFEEVGVVYRTPEAAALFLNELYYKDIKQWWNDEKIQSIRREFLEMYANNKPYFWPWLKAILKREI